MGLFVLNMEDTPTVEGLLNIALANLDLYSDYCGEGRYKDEIGQTPPDYLVTDFGIKYLREAIELLKKSEKL